MTVDEKLNILLQKCKTYEEREFILDYFEFYEYNKTDIYYEPSKKEISQQITYYIQIKYKNKRSYIYANQLNYQLNNIPSEVKGKSNLIALYDDLLEQLQKFYERMLNSE